MVRMVKTSADKQSATTPATAPVVADVATPSKAPRTKKPKVVAEVVQPVEVEQPVSTETSTPAPVDVVLTDAGSLNIKLVEFGAKIQQIGSIISTLKNDFKTLEKNVSREMKNAQKASSKRKRSGAARQPSGFVKPTRISDELAEFLGKTIGTEMARTVVSKEINQYIRANSLQDKTNGRRIIPDSKLLTLLKLNKEDELTYFNLQKYMKHHFIKAVVPAATA